MTQRCSSDFTRIRREIDIFFMTYDNHIIEHRDLA